jgi:hypothetical protein
MQDVFHLATYSFCVINEGSEVAVIQILLSPNGINWVEDPISDDHIPPGQMRILVYNRFARYVRLSYRTDLGLTKCAFTSRGKVKNCEPLPKTGGINLTTSFVKNQKGGKIKCLLR